MLCLQRRCNVKSCINLQPVRYEIVIGYFLFSMVRPTNMVTTNAHSNSAQPKSALEYNQHCTRCIEFWDIYEHLPDRVGITLIAA